MEDMRCLRQLNNTRDLSSLILGLAIAFQIKLQDILLLKLKQTTKLLMKLIATNKEKEESRSNLYNTSLLIKVETICGVR